MNKPNRLTFIEKLIIGALLFMVVFVGTTLYVVYHFITKFW